MGHLLGSRRSGGMDRNWDGMKQGPEGCIIAGKRWHGSCEVGLSMDRRSVAWLLARERRRQGIGSPVRYWVTASLVRYLRAPRA